MTHASGGILERDAHHESRLPVGCAGARVAQVMEAPLGALTLAWTRAAALLPLGWRTSGLYRFGEVWIALAEGPEVDDYASGSGTFAEQALRRLSDRLRERRGLTTG